MTPETTKKIIAVIDARKADPTAPVGKILRTHKLASHTFYNNVKRIDPGYKIRRKKAKRVKKIDAAPKIRPLGGKDEDRCVFIMGRPEDIRKILAGGRV